MTSVPRQTPFRILKDTLGDVVKPVLQGLGFKPYKSGKAKFPVRYYRELPGRIDVIDFQFDAYARPSFLVRFRSIDDPDDLTLIVENPDAMWDWNAYYHLNPSHRPRGWHRVGLITRWIAPAWGAKRVADRLGSLIPAMDAFLKGGPPTRHVSESILWDDPALGHVGRKPPSQRIGTPQRRFKPLS
jgi:hypothetical protein